ncbi:unnamed protein product [Amoebophrya sp. A120]|nr:unnamed protein product [Amoebophrya sp. A120]|eukprot:GSA120T00017771001.1
MATTAAVAPTGMLPSVSIEKRKLSSPVVVPRVPSGGSWADVGGTTSKDGKIAVSGGNNSAGLSWVVVNEGKTQRVIPSERGGRVLSISDLDSFALCFSDSERASIALSDASESSPGGIVGGNNGDGIGTEAKEKVAPEPGMVVCIRGLKKVAWLNGELAKVLSVDSKSNNCKILFLRQELARQTDHQPHYIDLRNVEPIGAGEQNSFTSYVTRFVSGRLFGRTASEDQVALEKDGTNVSAVSSSGLSSWNDLGRTKTRGSSRSPSEKSPLRTSKPDPSPADSSFSTFGPFVSATSPKSGGGLASEQMTTTSRASSSGRGCPAGGVGVQAAPGVLPPPPPPPQPASMSQASLVIGMTNTTTTTSGGTGTNNATDMRFKPAMRTVEEETGNYLGSPMPDVLSAHAVFSDTAHPVVDLFFKGQENSGSVHQASTGPPAEKKRSSADAALRDEGRAFASERPKEPKEELVHSGGKDKEAGLQDERTSAGDKTPSNMFTSSSTRQKSDRNNQTDGQAKKPPPPAGSGVTEDPAAGGSSSGPGSCATAAGTTTDAAEKSKAVNSKTIGSKGKAASSGAKAAAGTVAQQRNKPTTNNSSKAAASVGAVNNNREVNNRDPTSDALEHVVASVSSFFSAVFNPMSDGENEQVSAVNSGSKAGPAGSRSRTPQNRAVMNKTGGAAAAAAKSTKGTSAGNNKPGGSTTDTASGTQPNINNIKSSSSTSSAADPQSKKEKPAANTKPVPPEVGQWCTIVGLRKIPTLNGERAKILKEKDDLHWEISVKDFVAIVQKKNVTLDGRALPTPGEAIISATEE